MKYAADTAVPVERSRGEIERTLERYGAVAFMYGWDGKRAVISFDLNGRRYRVVLNLPDRNDPAFTRTPNTGRVRSAEVAMDAYDQAVRQRWRALALWIKAVLEAAESGILTLEEAMQSFVVLPNGTTAGQWLAPQIERAYSTGEMPALLPMLSDGQEEI